MTDGWEVRELRPGLCHVLPIKDLIEHDLSEDCICVPKAERVEKDAGGDGWVLTHASLDGRELVEDG